MGIQRQGFENHFKTTEIYKREVNIRQKDILEFDPDFGYFNIVTNDAWRMWQQAQKVTVPEPTKEVICAIENTVEDQLIASGITSDPFRLDGEKIYKAMIEAQEQVG